MNSRPFSLGVTYSTTVFTGLNTGTINLVDIVDSLGVTLPTTYTATINWGDGRTDSNVAVAHPNTDGTTVHVVASHTYTAGGTYRPIITLVDTAGSTLITVTANTATLIVGIDVSNKVSVTRSSPVKNRTTGFWAQTVTMNNISGVDLTGNVDWPDGRGVTVRCNRIHGRRSQSVCSVQHDWLESGQVNQSRVELRSANHDHRVQLQLQDVYRLRQDQEHPHSERRNFAIGYPACFATVNPQKTITFRDSMT